MTENQLQNIEGKAAEFVNELLAAVEPDQVADALNFLAECVRKGPDKIRRVFQPETRAKLENLMSRSKGKKMGMLDAIEAGSEVYEILFK